MSVEAITWALSCEIERSSAKFVLVVLANCSGPDFICWPSVSYLSAATCQDRKTVLENVRRLIESGHIEATGQRRGATNQVVVYRLVGVRPDAIKQAQNRNGSEIGTVPETDSNSTGIPPEQSRNSRGTVPKTGHGTVNEPSLEPSRNQRERAKALPTPAGVDEQVWSDWLRLRKAKKAPVTQTVLAGAVSEAAKAGLSLEAFLRVWCRRGSQGLEADWLKPNERGRGAAGPPAEPEWRRQQRERNEAFLGPAAQRRTHQNVIDLEPSDATPRLVG